MEPEGVRFTPSGRHVYVSSEANDRIDVAASIRLACAESSFATASSRPSGETALLRFLRQLASALQGQSYGGSIRPTMMTGDARR